MARVKLRNIMGCPRLKCDFRQKSLVAAAAFILQL